MFVCLYFYGESEHTYKYSYAGVDYDGNGSARTFTYLPCKCRRPVVECIYNARTHILYTYSAKGRNDSGCEVFFVYFHYYLFSFPRIYIYTHTLTHTRCPLISLKRFGYFMRPIPRVTCRPTDRRTDWRINVYRNTYINVCTDTRAAPSRPKSL